MEPLKLKQIIEAALLAADEPLTVDQLVKLFRSGEVDEETIRADVREVLKTLTAEAEERGFELKRVASGYRYQVRQELSQWISRLWEEKPPRYTRALLETLALVAYRQPVTRGDIEQVRGVSVSQNIMRTLLERGWIRVVGQREVPGRPAMFGTTKAFLDYFNLKSLDELPPLAEIRELIEPMVVEEIAAPPPVTDLPVDVVDDAEGGLPIGGIPAGETEADQAAPDSDGVEIDLSDSDAAADHDVSADLSAEENSAAEAAQPGEESAGQVQVVDVTVEPVEEVEKPTAEVVQLPRAPH